MSDLEQASKDVICFLEMRECAKTQIEIHCTSKKVQAGLGQVMGNSKQGWLGMCPTSAL